MDNDTREIPAGEAYFSARPIVQNYPDELVYGYYVYCRGHHYILQAYNEAGYDERWEAADWVEIQKKSLYKIK